MIALPTTRPRTRTAAWAAIAATALVGGLASIRTSGFLPFWVVVMAASQGLVSLASP